MNGDSTRDDVPMQERLIRGLFMLLFAIAFNIVEVVLLAVAVLQFLIVISTGTANDRLRLFGASLSAYAFQIFRFLTYNSERRPWPFSDWPPPSAPPSQDHGGHV